MPKQPRVWPVKEPYKRILPFHLLLQGRWFYLCHALLIMIFFYPYHEELYVKQKSLIFNIFESGILVFIIYSVSFNRRQIFLTGLLLLPALIHTWIPFSAPWDIIPPASLLGLYTYAIILIVPYLIETREVGIDELFGSFSLYLLIGLTWASIYLLIEKVFPGSFYVASVYNQDGIVNMSEFIYYSFITLTTLGYGDIVPISPFTRSISILEALTGIFFIALVFSRAVSLYVLQAVRNYTEEDTQW